jgi:hypothetical protein
MSSWGGPTDPFSLSLSTCRKRWIHNRRREELSAATRTRYDARWSSAHPNARLRSSATTTYNCVGMALASRRTWVQTDQIGPILSDDDYRMLDTPDEIDVGDLVIYHDPTDGGVTHIGIIIAHRAMADERQHIEVISKWGAVGEFLHDLYDVPDDYGSPGQFWTDRR